MGTRKKIPERRKERRVRPSESALLVGADAFGQILDLSRGGLAYEGPEGPPPPAGRLHIGILLGDSGRYYGELQGVGVYDLPLPGAVPGGSRRRSLRFTALTPEQLEQLEELIRRFGGSET